VGSTVHRPVVRIGDDPRIAELFREILDLLAGGYGRTLLVQASQALGYLLARLARRAHEPQPGLLGPRERMLQALHYMRHHLDHPLRVADLAAMARLSPSHFATLFRQQTGYSVIDYFLRLRIHRACQLLDTTDLPVKDIAARVGFMDALYFSRVFRTVLGTPPSNYRDQHKG
jgi:transcriptional regulator GlxA family with amidase domain